MGGGGISSFLEGSGGGKVDGKGWRGIGSSGCWAAIVADIHGFLTIGGGVGWFLVGRWWGLGLRWGDWSSLASPGECVVVVAAVWAVRRGGGAAA